MKAMERGTDSVPTPARPRPLAIAPPLNDAVETSPLMERSCRTCAVRKVKCDKVAPRCSACRKSKLDCLYQPLQARRRKRKLSDDLNPAEKIARYERILLRLGILDPDGTDDPPSTCPDSSPAVATSRQAVSEDDSIPLRFIPWGHSQMNKVGKLLTASPGNSRYLDSDLWGDLDNDEDDGHPLSDNEQPGEDLTTLSIVGMGLSDPLTAAFMGTSKQSLFQYHPTHSMAMTMWQVHAHNVEPLCKILHVPSVAAMIDTVSKQPESATGAEECLVFAIYHFAVFSMTEEECIQKLGQPRALLSQQYHFAARQAFVNASFLKTTDMSVLQAIVLFLLACRQTYDPHTLWMLTGVAVRIAQRMGLHRDGDSLGLPPFQVQMRRRLFYQLMPLDATASQLSGVGIMIPPDTWDTQPALNVNDDQIWPDMTEPPRERQGATDMIFCLSRFCIGKSIAGAGKKGQSTLSGEFKDYTEAEQVITEAEKEVEEKYIRYCDIINPLHFLAVGLARSGITAMRLRVRLPRIRTSAATDEERRETMQLAQKILDTDSAAHDHPTLAKRFRWYMSTFFLWGMWDSLVFILTTLGQMRPGLLSGSEIQCAWERIERVYQNHPDLLDTKRALNVAFQRLTLRAWDASHLNSVQDGGVCPKFIKTLQSLRDGGKGAATEERAPVSSFSEGATRQDTSLEGNHDPGLQFELTVADSDYELEHWAFWERLIESDSAVRTDVTLGNGGL